MLRHLLSTAPAGARTRLRAEHGFTLIELLVVLVVLGVLVLIAVPSYLGYKDRASHTAAKANVQNAIPAVEVFFADNNGVAGDIDGSAATSGYEGMSIAQLQTIDSSIAAGALTLTSLSSSSYCLSSTIDGKTWSRNGPSAALVQTTCP